ncbi:MAG: hypothetical protein AAF251_16170 [Pseudomonadota bacterium]
MTKDRIEMLRAVYGDKTVVAINRVKRDPKLGSRAFKIHRFAG